MSAGTRVTPAAIVTTVTISPRPPERRTAPSHARRAGRAAKAVPLAVLLAALQGCAALSGAPDGVRSVGAGLAAHAVCSGAFVAGRAPGTVFDADVRPLSRVTAILDVSVDAHARAATGRAPGVAPRTARWLPGRGCVLDAPAPTAATQPAPARLAPRDAPWPAGDRALDATDWGPRVDAAALRRALDAAFVGAGDPARANARAIAVVHAGRLLVDRGAAGFEPGMPLHGWSMTKTLVAMLADRMAADGRLDLAAPVVVAAAGPREPAWLAAWRTDARARITVEDLLRMRDGLDHVEDYGAGGSVARMLYGQRDVAAFAAAAPVSASAGERWRYLSASTNLLSRVLRARFPDDVSYLAAPRSEILEPIGARTITVGTDLDGTFVGSSFGWASAADWARLGELTRLDGRWGTRQVLAPGWLARASRPARPDGEGRGYGAQIWRIADPVAGRCRGRGLPDDTLAMQGYGGQIVAIVPSREAVVVRLGYSFDRRTFDECGFVADVLSALR